MATKKKAAKRPGTEQRRGVKIEPTELGPLELAVESPPDDVAEGSFQRALCCGLLLACSSGCGGAAGSPAGPTAGQAGALACPVTRLAADAQGCIDAVLTRNTEGRVECSLMGSALEQVPVAYDAFDGAMLLPGTGWYYDDFSEQATTCPEGFSRIAFTGAEAPAAFVLECRHEAPPTDVNSGRTDLASFAQPSIGDPCDAGGSGLDCARRLVNGELDEALFCHRPLQLCVLACQSEADCPPGWSCGPNLAAGVDRSFCHIAACR